MMNQSRLNRIFRAMKARCYNVNTSYYYLYGGKGITICDEWLNKERVCLGPQGNPTKGYVAFKEWALSHGYRDDLTIDRIDNSKGYSPDNCRWVDYKTQSNNRSYNVKITYNNETHNMREWADILGMSYQVLKMRFHRGWSIERMFKQHVRKSK